jgi:outer membrane protein assembly factor BamE (lipoprotein component of BamABCDE complex)
MKLFTAAVAIGVAAFVAGCASAGRQINPDLVSMVHKGSTRQDVRGVLGAPQQFTRDIDGNESWVYVYAHSQVKGTTFIPIYGAFAGGVDTQTQSVTVKFDKSGLVTGVESSASGLSTDNGAQAGRQPNPPEVSPSR